MEQQFTIKDEFKNLINPPTDEEKQILEQQIINDGVRHPLTVWKEQNILIDGHTRLEICQKLNLPYEVEYLSFPDEDHVISWMSNNQLGRRNITMQQISYLRGKKYEAEKKIHGGDRKSESEESRSKNFILIPDTVTKTARKLGIPWNLQDHLVSQVQAADNEIYIKVEKFQSLTIFNIDTEKG
ncbi:MAG: hypothetical protein AB7U45_10305 [Desulfamplus sp.]